jgi:hypothetical protein
VTAAVDVALRDGSTVVDARVRIAAPRPARPYPSLDR